MTNQETTKDVGVRVALVTGGRRGIGSRPDRYGPGGEIPDERI